MKKIIVGCFGGCFTLIISFILLFIGSAIFASVLMANTDIELSGEQVLPLIFIASILLTISFFVIYSLILFILRNKVINNKVISTHEPTIASSNIDTISLQYSSIDQISPSQFVNSSNDNINLQNKSINTSTTFTPLNIKDNQNKIEDQPISDKNNTNTIPINESNNGTDKAINLDCADESIITNYITQKIGIRFINKPKVVILNNYIVSLWDESIFGGGTLSIHHKLDKLVFEGVEKLSLFGNILGEMGLLFSIFVRPLFQHPKIEYIYINSIERLVIVSNKPDEKLFHLFNNNDDNSVRVIIFIPINKSDNETIINLFRSLLSKEKIQVDTYAIERVVNT